MTDPDWEKVLVERYGQTSDELAAEAERGYDVSQPRPVSTTRDFSKVERFEVIDHRMETIAAERPARVIVATGAKVTLSFQDSGRTLKVFLSDE
jgi:hypothetical protein